MRRFLTVLSVTTLFGIGLLGVAGAVYAQPTTTAGGGGGATTTTVARGATTTARPGATTTTARAGATATTATTAARPASGAPAATRPTATTGARTDMELGLAGLAFIAGGALLFFGQPIRRMRARA